MMKGPKPTRKLSTADFKRPLISDNRAAAFQDVRPAHHSQQRNVLPRPVVAQPQVSPAGRRRFAPPRTRKSVRRQRLLRLERYGLVASAPLVIIASVRLSASPTIGEVVIGGYGLLALILRIPGRVSFWYGFDGTGDHWSRSNAVA